MDQEDWAEAERLLKEGISSFDRAVGHDDPRYSAEAYYHRSKAHWRLWRITRSPEDLKAAIADSEEAARRYYEDRFVRWVEYLQDNAASGNSPALGVGGVSPQTRDTDTRS